MKCLFNKQTKKLEHQLDLPDTHSPPGLKKVVLFAEIFVELENIFKIKIKQRIFLKKLIRPELVFYLQSDLV